MTLCKICNHPTALYGVCDFNKNCEERFGTFLPLSGTPVWYVHCTNCNCIFTTHCDNWTDSDYSKNIYNKDYALVDPDWETKRPTDNAELVANLFTPCTLIDFGGGSGKLADILNTRGFNASTYDPYFNTTYPQHKADLVTCFEVFEHTSTPHETLAACVALMKPTATLFFSTLALDFLSYRAMDAECDASYISPRNGHITLHKMKSVHTLCNMHGLEIHTTDGRFFTGTLK